MFGHLGCLVESGPVLRYEDGGEQERRWTENAAWIQLEILVSCAVGFRRCNNNHVIKRYHKSNNINSPLVTITLNLLFILLQTYFIKG